MPTVKVDQVAKALNVPATRVQRLAREGMPRAGRGEYDLGQCMAWYIRYLQKALEARDMPTVNVEQCAEELNVTGRRVQQLAQEGMQRAVRGEYDRRQCTRWYIRYLQKALESRAAGDGSGVMGLALERARLAREQADRAARENAERRGELAPISVMAKKFGDAVAVAQALLLAIPTREAPMLAPLTDANAIHARLTQAIYDALHELADYGERFGAGRSGSRAVNGAVRPAARPNGKRVGRGRQEAQ